MLLLLLLMVMGCFMFCCIYVDIYQCIAVCIFKKNMNSCFWSWRKFIYLFFYLISLILTRISALPPFTWINFSSFIGREISLKKKKVFNKIQQQQQNLFEFEIPAPSSTTYPMICLIFNLMSINMWLIFAHIINPIFFH